MQPLLNLILIIYFVFTGTHVLFAEFLGFVDHSVKHTVHFIVFLHKRLMLIGIQVSKIQ
jgi:hypothetical protein